MNIRHINFQWRKNLRNSIKAQYRNLLSPARQTFWFGGLVVWGGKGEGMGVYNLIEIKPTNSTRL